MISVKAENTWPVLLFFPLFLSLQSFIVWPSFHSNLESFFSRKKKHLITNLRHVTRKTIKQAI